MERSNAALLIRLVILLLAIAATVTGAFLFAMEGLSGGDTGGANFLFWSGLIVTVIAALSLLYEWGRRRADREARKP